jgi:hypothetical protein
MNPDSSPAFTAADNCETWEFCMKIVALILLLFYTAKVRLKSEGLR